MPRLTIQPALPQIKPAGVRQFHTRLHAWYEAHGRHHLPWRQTGDAYAIWLSEVMLQQTQVATVLDRFYHPFLKTFPTLTSLANAPREKVMKAWEGLGYYRRAGYLHEAAKQITGLSPRRMTGSILRSKKGGPRHEDGVTMPRDEEALLALPGIGRNTARAIQAFAYREPVAILEANLKRVVARIFALETPNERELWAGAEFLLNPGNPFDYNQAMMDIGATVCTPRNPACLICPANGICRGQVNPEAYPTPKVKKAVPVRRVDIEALEDAQGRFYLVKREEALLGGTYGFPQHPTQRTNADAIGEVTHTYSHFKLIGRVLHRRLEQPATDDGWYSREAVARLPLSRVDHKVLALVENRHSSEKNRGKAELPRRAR